MKKIRSTFVLQKIFSYTSDIFKLKLFSYSKLYQKKLNISFI